MGKITALLLIVLALLTSPATAQTFAGRGPWVPGPPDACSSLSVACAQIDDFNLTLRVSGMGLWGGPVHGGAGAAGVTVSFYKTMEVGLSLPLAVLAGAPTIYGPPQLRLRWRLGPRMGPAPFGGRWPDDEPYPKAIPAAYDLRPSVYTLSVGFGFRPLWPGVRGEGPIECSASDTGCLAEVSASATVDLRAWRFLLTAQLEAAAAGRRGELRAGGRVALDLFGTASAFGEGSFRQGIEGGRGGLLLLGGQLRGFRGATLSGFYGRSFGGLTTDHIGGAQLDVPIGLLWGALQRLSEAVDPFVAGDGWIYDDECAPLFRLGRRSGREVAIGDGLALGPTVPVGTHLWRRGGWLYHDQAGARPFAPVGQRQGGPAAVPIDEGAHPWPDAAAARRSAEARAAWLHRYALAPDPRRRALCAELLGQMLEGLARAAARPTLGEQCQQAREEEALALAAIEGGGQEDGSGAGAAALGARANVHLVCGEGVTPQTMGALASALRPSGGGLTVAGARRPPPGAGTATHAPPAAAQPAGGTATHAPPAAAPGRRQPAGAAPGTATHAPPTPAAAAAAAPGPRAAPAAPTPKPAYSELKPPKKAVPGGKVTKMQKKLMREENAAANGGGMKDDRTGEPLVPPKRHLKGVTPPDNEAHIDHVHPRSKGGSNDYGNLQVIGRKHNLAKGDKVQ